MQDDWQVTPQLKLLYGVRYDVFDVPSARPFAPNPYSQDFTIDKNNFGPRAGLSWAVDEAARTVVRASVGLMYEPPLLDFYDNAILNNGDPKSFNIGPLLPTAVGAPRVSGQPRERRRLDSSCRSRASPRSIRISGRSRRGSATCRSNAR